MQDGWLPVDISSGLHVLRPDGWMLSVSEFAAADPCASRCSCPIRAHGARPQRENREHRRRTCSEVTVAAAASIHFPVG